MSVFRRSLMMAIIALGNLVKKFQNGIMTLNNKGRGNKVSQSGDTIRLTPTH